MEHQADQQVIYLLEHLVEDAPQGIIVVNDGGVIVRVNRHLEKLFGYNRDEMLGSSVDMLIPESLRGNHAALRAGYAEDPISRPMGEGLRLMGRRKDGSEVAVEVGLSSIDAPDGHLTVAHIYDDTFRRRSEESQVIRESRLSGELEAREAELQLADQVAAIITSTLDINQVFEKFAEEAKNLVDFDHATIVVIDQDTEKLVVDRYLRTGPIADDPRLTWELEGTQTEQVILTGKTIIIDDLTEETGLRTDGFLIDAGFRSSILTPLVYNDRTIGAMSLASNKNSAFGPREKSILERMARQIAPAVDNARLYSESVSRTAELECLLNLAEILGQTIPFEDKIFQVMEQLVEVSDGFSAHFRVPDATNQELVLTVLARLSDEPAPSWPRELGEGSISFQAFQQGSPLVIGDYQNHPNAHPYAVQMGIRSAVYLPISAGDQSAALVTVDSKELDHFTPDRVRLLTAIGDELGALLENSRLSEELRSSTQEMGLADQVAKIITSTLDIEQEYERFALEVRKLFDFDRMSLLDMDRSSDSYTIRSTWGLEIPSLRPGTIIQLEDSGLGLTLRSKERILMQDLAPPFNVSVHPSLFEAGLRSVMVVPLIFNDQVTGGIAVLSRCRGAFGLREKRIMERLASQIAPAVENARLFRETQERAQEIQRLHEFTNRILDSNPSALVVLRGTEREVVTVNSSFRAAFWSDRDPVEGRPLSQVLDWVGLEEWIRESIASPLGEGRKETRYLDQDGAERWFSVSAVPLPVEDETGHEEEILLVLNDITEQRQQQERLQAQSRLASMGQLASGVAHEINNPLAAIHGYSELLQMENLPSQAIEDARKIQEAVQRAAKVVQNLLSFARKSVPEKQWLDAASVIDRAIELKVHDFDLGNIRVATHHDQGVPKTMLDEHQIIQVTLNILTNAEQAIKARPGPGEITVATRLVRNMVRISISDDGLGIPSEHLHRIFDPFFTTKGVGEGTGLGLSICYGLVRDHGGEMWVESTEGQGATFHIELPVLPDEGTAKPRSADATGVPVSKRRILVVDDEPEVGEILLRALSADGHQVALASDGENAWKLIQGNDYDRIFVDLRMPGIDGRELYQRIREWKPDLAERVVFITGDTANPETRRFLSSTGGPVLTKPFTIDAIRQLL